MLHTCRMRYAPSQPHRKRKREISTATMFRSRQLLSVGWISFGPRSLAAIWYALSMCVFSSRSLFFWIMSASIKHCVCFLSSSLSFFLSMLGWFNRFTMLKNSLDFFFSFVSFRLCLRLVRFQWNRNTWKISETFQSAVTKDSTNDSHFSTI